MNKTITKRMKTNLIYRVSELVLLSAEQYKKFYLLNLIDLIEEKLTIFLGNPSKKRYKDLIELIKLSENIIKQLEWGNKK